VIFYVRVDGRSLWVLYLFEWVLCILQIVTLFFVWCIERSRKLMELCNSFSVVNFTVGCSLNSVKVSSMYVFTLQSQRCI
jgi:hypothetical protein